MAILPLSSDVTGMAGASGPDLTRYFLVCGALLAGVGALAFLARRYLARHLRLRASRRSLQVVDVLPLGGRQKLCVVRCYDRTFLLGLGDREVRSIAELDADTVTGTDPEAIADAASAALLAHAEDELVAAPFGEQLEAELSTVTPPERGPEPAPAGDARRAPWNTREGILG